MSDWLTELRTAHGELASEKLFGTDAGIEAWNRLSALIQEGPPVSAVDALQGFDGEPDLSIEDMRREVQKALYEAATSGNVTAVLKWLDLHRGEFDRPEAPAVASGAAEGSESVPESRAHSGRISDLEDAFSV